MHFRNALVCVMTLTDGKILMFFVPEHNCSNLTHSIASGFLWICNKCRKNLIFQQINAFFKTIMNVYILSFQPMKQPLFTKFDVCITIYKKTTVKAYLEVY